MLHPVSQQKRAKRLMRFRRELPLHLIMLPGVIMLAIFAYFPMYGNIIAFKTFKPGLGILGSPWAGLKYFDQLFNLPDIGNVFSNTITIAVSKILLNTIAAIVVALMLNECRSKSFTRIVQTVIYMPHFMSWVILGTIFTAMLSADGIVNKMLEALNLNKVFFLGDNAAFRATLLVTDVWKNVGFGTVVYLAAITGIDPTLYEAAVMDGAGRLRQTWHVTLPGMMPIIVLLAMLNLGKLLNAGFDQIFNLYNTLVKDTSDILDTMVYRLGMQSAKYSLSTAVGLLKSVISVILIGSSYYLSYRFADYRVF